VRSRASSAVPGWLADLERIDVAVYAAVAGTPSPSLDDAMRRVSHAADKSKPWIVAAGLLAATGGQSGRRAAASGLAAVAVSSALVNAVLKPVGRRRRPDRDAHMSPVGRHVSMPRSTSLPSGHSASAFAFAAGVGRVLPQVGAPLYAAAATVAYSRVHTGVHYPGDVVAGAVLGEVIAQATGYTIDRRTRTALRR
jgi:undecaprenyl-diphosphatase